ncbi:MAG: NRDE family protein [Armatimonadetes bacterium]|nr:NRDE family protein [Akkermansiaceae bacterium]
MCSAAWSFQDGGYQLAFNRDEKWLRPPASDPTLETDHPVPGICARDSQGHGTWLFTNQHGLTLALLNAYPPGQNFAAGKISRGHIPLLAAQATNPASLITLLNHHPWPDYAPCHLLLIAEDHLSLFTWSGSRFSKDPAPPQPYLTSSSVHPEQTRKIRTRRFLEIQSRPLEEILADTSNPDPPSNIHVTRADGGTVSQILILVTREKITFSLTSRDQPKMTIAIPRIH